MPITFEQPQPVAPGISAAYGATEQLSRDLPHLADIYQRNAALQAQQGQAAQALQAQLIGQQSQVGERRLEMQQHGMDQAAQFATARLPSERDAFLIQGQLAEQNNRAQNAAWLNQQQLSQQEALDLQRMQSNVGWVAQQYNDGVISYKDANDLITELKTRIDPMKQRQERALAQMHEQQVQQRMHMAAEQAAITSEDAATRAAAVKRMTFQPYEDSDEKWLFGPDGKPVHLKREQPPKDTEAAAEAKFQLEAMKAEQTAAFKAAQHYADLAIKTREHLEKRKQAKTPEGKPAEPDLSTNDDLYRSTAEGLLRQAAGGAGSMDEYVQQELGRHRAIMDRFRPKGGGAGAPSNVAGNAPAGEPRPVSAAAAEFKPFDLSKPETMHPKQRATTDQIKEWYNRAGMIRDEREAREMQKQAMWALGRMEQYGDPAHMPPELRDHFVAVINALGRLPQFATPSSAPRPGGSGSVIREAYNQGLPGGA